MGKLLLLGVNNGRGGHTEAPELKLEGWGDDEWSRAETEPFLHRPSRQR